MNFEVMTAVLGLTGGFEGVERNLELGLNSFWEDFLVELRSRPIFSSPKDTIIHNLQVSHLASHGFLSSSVEPSGDGLDLS